MALCFVQLKRRWNGRGRKIINHHIVEGTRESNPRVHDLQHPRLGKPRCGLQIMDTRIGFPCPFHSVVIDSISPASVYPSDRLSVCPIVTHSLFGIEKKQTSPIVYAFPSPLKAFLYSSYLATKFTIYFRRIVMYDSFECNLSTDRDDRNKWTFRN